MRALAGALAALAAAVAVPATALPTVAQADTSGSIAGTVTDGVTHAAQSSVWVYAYDANGNYVKSTPTDAGGRYTISGLPAGNYELQFDPTDGHVQQYYNGRATLASADPVTVVSGVVTSKIDAALAPGGGISGKVTDAVTHTPVDEVEVTAYDSQGNYVASATTGVNGRYSMRGLPSANYRVQFTPAEDSPYGPVYYATKQTLSQASAVAVGAPQTTTGVDEQLVAATRITGTVTDASSGAPLSDVSVTAFDADGSDAGGATTAADGTYSIAGLTVGAYRVLFTPDGTVNDAPQYSGGASTLVAASSVTAVAGKAVSANSALATGKTITGTVSDASTHTPLEGVQVAAWTPSGDYAGEGYSSDDGTYTIQGLAAGTYAVGFFPSDNAHGPIYYNGKPSLATADAVTAGATGINAALGAGASLSGTVTDARTGAGVPFSEVYLYDSTGEITQATTTGSDGTYTIGGLGAGSYRVWFGIPYSTAYAPQYYNGAATLAAAQAITLGSGQAVSGIDAAMQGGGAVEGTATAAGAGSPLAGISVTAFGQNLTVESTTTDTSGHYSLGGLEAGSYSVGFADPTGAYLGAVSASSPVAVTDGSTTKGADAALSAAGSIGGTVTDASSGAGLAGVTVQAIGRQGGSGFASTNADGTYTLTGLAPDVYTVTFTGASAGNYQPKPYDKTVTVTLGGAVTGIDAALASGGQIAGKITDAVSGAAVSSADVTVYDAAGNFAGSTSSGSDGTYFVAGLGSGAYRLGVSYPSGAYSSAYYNGKGSLSAADAISVTAGAVTGAINVTLQPSGDISGTVTDAALDAPLPEALVTVYDGQGNTVGQQETAPDGTYEITGLEPGAYHVGFQHRGYADRYYDTETSLSAADAVTVIAGHTAGSIDMAMPRRAVVEGTVTGAPNGTPLGGVDVTIDDASTGDYVADVDTDPDGTYAVTGLPTGTYTAYFWPAGATNFLPQYLGDTSDLADAQTFTVSDGQIRTGVDAELDIGGEITGHVTGRGGSGAAGVDVAAWNADEDVFASAITDANGDYTLVGLGTDSYTVQFTNEDGAYLWQYYDGTTDYQAAAPVSVTAGETTPGIDATLAPAVQIQGTVTDASTDQPIQGITVSALDSTGFPVGSTTTATDGTYDVAGLSAGDYSVEFSVGDASTDYVTQYYKGASTLGTASTVSATDGQIVTGIDASMQPAGAISGTVTDVSTRSAIDGTTVDVYDSSGAYVTSSSTIFNGSYTVSGLVPGNYRVQFAGPGSYISQFYNGRSTLAAADPVTVTAGNTAANVNAALLAGSSISGTVTDASTGRPVAFTAVEAFTTSGAFAGFADTDSSGHYTIMSLPDGAYDVEFFDSGYLFQYYDDSATPAGAQAVTVSTGQATTGIDAALDPGAKITGTVSDARNGKPIANVPVVIYNAHGSFQTEAVSGSDGTYTVSGLAPGGYEVGFGAGGAMPSYLPQFYPGTSSLAAAQTVTTTDLQTTSGIDAAMQPGATIEGNVTDATTGAPLGQASVELYNSSGTAIGFAPTGADGSYAAGSLAAGTYRVEFSASGHLGQYYNNEATLAAADPVNLTAAQDRTGINAALVSGGQISGSVTGGDGSALTGATVFVYDANNTFVTSTLTGSGGTYTISGLSTGNYHVEFSAAGYAPQFYNGETSLAAADPVAVTAGSVTSSINAKLGGGGSITGRVTDAVTGQALTGTAVTVVPTSGSTDPEGTRPTAVTDSSGNYTISGLSTGSYNVSFSATGYLGRSYGADPARVTYGQTTSGINQALTPAASLSGRVTDAGSHAGLQNARVTAYGTNGGFVASTLADATGAYAITGLAAGTYRVGFTDSTSSGNYLPQYYNGETTLAAADPVTLQTGQAASGIDAGLTPGAEIEGTVTDAGSGAGVSGVQVEAETASGSVLSTATTDVRGAYSLGGLTAGTYVVQYFPGSSTNDLPQYYDGKSTLASATPVTVSDFQVLTGVNVALQPGGQITGTVTSAKTGNPIAGVQVALWTGSQIVMQATSDVLGHYTLNQLTTGSYEVSFHDPVGLHRDQYYDDAATAANATAIAVTTGLTTSGIDASLTAAGRVTGSVLDAENGGPVSGATVTLYDADSAQVATTTSDIGGGYSFAPLAGGQYFVGFSTGSSGGNYGPAYYNGETTLVGADPVTVTDEVTSSGVNGHLTSLPVNTTAPGVTGTPQQGQSLNEIQGAWTHHPTSYRYQWLRCNAVGSGCVLITGATGQTYTLVADDVGHTIEVQETAHNAGGDGQPTASAATAVILPAPPVVQTPPAITGNPAQGQTLIVQHGAWTNNPTSYDDQWLRCDSSGANCAAIPGATSTTYTATADDIGSTLAVSETASNAGGAGTPAQSSATALVTPPPPTNTSPPTISGDAQDGATLTEGNGGWTGSPSSYAYEWLRCDTTGSNCAVIGGADQQSYTVVGGDVGHTIEVQETAFNDGGASDPASSAPTAPVIATVPVSVLPPSIRGSAQQSQTLTEVNGLWDKTPASFAYQWLRCDANGDNCALIDGATGQTYVLSSADVGSTIEVTEVAINAAGDSDPSIASPTALVLPAPPQDINPPSLSGSAVQGQTLQARDDTWMGSPTAFAYTWERCDSSEANCAPISGATSDTYTATADDIGFTLLVSETASNAGGTSDPVQSPATAAVRGDVPHDNSGPSISGQAIEGQSLTEAHGSWTNGPTSYTYHWERCDNSGANCAVIAGATDQAYTLVDADVGSTLRVSETAANAAGPASSAATSDPSAVVAAAVPQNTRIPTITGDAQQGVTLSEHHGSWTNSPTSYSYQWLRCSPAGADCTDIARATDQTYIPVTDDVAHTLEVQEVATNAAGDSTPATAAVTTQVSGSAPADVTSPSIAGLSQVGQTLTEGHGSWTSSPSGYAYQWVRCDSSGASCSPISGQTGRTYVLTGDDLGHTLKVSETASNDSGSGSAAVSSTTAPVTAAPSPPPTSTGAPQVTGTAQQGLTLSESAGTWSGSAATVALQWLRCDAGGANCDLILGAVGPQYALTAQDVGHAIAVQESATTTDGVSASAQSPATAIVRAAPVHADAGEPIDGITTAPVTFDASGSTPANLISSYTWQFGDGASATGASVQHTYARPGTYQATVTVSTGAGTDSATVAVTISGSVANGVRVTVEDAGNAVIPGADVVYVAADGSRTQASTDTDGVAGLQGLPDGTQSLYVYAPGYRVATAQVAVSGGAGNTTVTLTPGQVATATLTSTPMTLEQIEAAGIDVSDPANQVVDQFQVGLNFDGAPALCGHENSAGQFVGPTGSCGGGGGSGWICSTYSCSAPTGGGGGSVEAVPAMVDGNPMIEWLIIDGQASMLKQFFSVDMVIQNLSPEPVELSDGSATLSLPDALSLAPISSPRALTQSVPTIPGMGSADVNWIVRGDQPGFWPLSATYNATLQPFGKSFALQAALEKPLHVWGPEALSLSVQADSGTLSPGQPYHVRIGLTNNADVPFYNVGLSVDSTQHQHYLFQPDERFSDSVGELDPGKTIYSHTYVLVPNAASPGAFDPSKSFVMLAGQVVTGGGGIQGVTPPTRYTLTAPTDTVGEVHLHWQPVPGAQGYEVFSIPDLNTQFADNPDEVDDASQNATTELPSSATDALIPAPAGSARYYAVSSMINGRPTLEHSVIVGTPGTALGTGSGDGGGGEGAGGVGGAGGGRGSSGVDGGMGAPVPTCADHVKNLRGGVTVEASCFEGSGSTFKATGQIRINGLDITASGGFTLNTSTLTLSGGGTVTVHAGSLTIYRAAGGFSWTLNLRKQWSTPDGLKIKGLPVSGDISVGFSAGGADAELNASVDAPVAVSGTIDLKMTLDGLHLDSFKLALSSDIPLKGLLIKEASLAYSDKAGKDVWTGDVAIEMPKGPEIEGTLTVTNGSLTDVGLDAKKINKPIGEVIFLQSLGLHVTLHPKISATGSIGLSAGPEVDGKTISTLDGSLTAELGSPFVLKASGTLKLVDQPVESASVTATIPGGVTFEGETKRDLAGVSLDTQIGGTISSTDLEAEGSATLKAGPVSAGGYAVINTVGVAGCATAKALWAKVSIGAAYRWETHTASLLDGSCGFTELKGAVAATAAAVQRTVAVPPGLSQLNLIIHGAGAPPAVRLVAGHQSVVVTPGSVGHLGHSAYVAIADPADDETAIALAGPPAGRLSVRSAPGGALLRTVGTTTPLPAASVRARLSNARGGRRRLRFAARPIAGQRIVFEDRDAHGMAILAASTAAHGTVAFTPRDPGVAGVHVIQAVVQQYGLPRIVIRLASFRVAGIRLRAPKVSLRVSHGKARIAWTAVPGAAGYDVTVASTDGRRLFYAIGPHVHTKAIAPGGTITARVQAVGATGAVGPTGTARRLA